MGILVANPSKKLFDMASEIAVKHGISVRVRKFIEQDDPEYVLRIGAMHGSDFDNNVIGAGSLETYKDLPVVADHTIVRESDIYKALGLAVPENLLAASNPVVNSTDCIPGTSIRLEQQNLYE